MKIAIIYPDYLPGAKPRRDALGSFSEGIGSIASVLKRSGHQVRLVHLTSPALPGGLEETLAQWQPDVIGFSTRSSNFADVVRHVSWIRGDPRIQAILVAGGYHATLAPRETLLDGRFDFVLGGEADFTFAQLCDALSRGHGYKEIAGLAYRSYGTIEVNFPAQICEDLDSVPYPDVGIFDVKRLEAYAMKTVPAILSRGCTFSCSYCCNAAFRAFHGNPASYLRFRSPENSIGYLKAMLAHFPGARYVSFMDNILPFRRNWFREFARLYTKEIELPYACNARADLFTEQVADLLKASGCYRIHFGVESGNPALRREILGRSMSNECIAKAFDICRRKGMAALAYNMVGLPGETLEAAWETVVLNASIRPERVLAPTFYPYPGSKAYELALEKGRIVEDRESGQLIVDQPGFTWQEAKFASFYFRSFVRLVRLAGVLPFPLKGFALSAAKCAFCWRGKPHSLLNRSAGFLFRARDVALALAKRRFGRAYLRVRDLSLGKALVAGTRKHPCRYG